MGRLTKKKGMHPFCNGIVKLLRKTDMYTAVSCKMYCGIRQETPPLLTKECTCSEGLLSPLSLHVDMTCMGRFRGMDGASAAQIKSKILMMSIQTFGAMRKTGATNIVMSRE